MPKKIMHLKSRYHKYVMATKRMFLPAYESEESYISKKVLMF